MTRRFRSSLAALLVFGIAATALALTRPADRVTGVREDVCTGCDCFAPATCGDREDVCPAGPDCWMPNVCPDRTVVCSPAAPERA
ncbi:MAG: hypothetical protein AAGB93_22570, partial [Planctomycetota bacterium]